MGVQVADLAAEFFGQFARARRVLLAESERFLDAGKALLKIAGVWKTCRHALAR